MAGPQGVYDPLGLGPDNGAGAAKEEIQKSLLEKSLLATQDHLDGIRRAVVGIALILFVSFALSFVVTVYSLTLDMYATALFAGLGSIILGWLIYALTAR